VAVGRILVVDDEVDILLFMQEALEPYGHEVTGAVSGFEALDFLGEQDVDLIILDLRMPDITGLELLERIRKGDADVPIIICSGYPKLADDYRVWGSRVAAVLYKPVDPDQLVREVAGALQGGRAGGREAT